MGNAIAKDAVTGLILAGGQGSRMGSADKGLQPFRGAAMVLHVMQRLSPQVATAIINANRNLPAYQAFGVAVWPDRTAGFAGPLAGLQAGLLHCATPYLACVPCDSPFLPLDLVARLGDAMQDDRFDLAVAATGDAADRQVHPVFCLLKTSLLPHLDAYLENGGRKVSDWLMRLKVAEVLFPDERAFCNINTPEDLNKFDTAG